MGSQLTILSKFDSWSEITNTGNQFASIIQNANFAQAMSGANSLNNAISLAEQGNYIVSGL